MAPDPSHQPGGAPVNRFTGVPREATSEELLLRHPEREGSLQAASRIAGNPGVDGNLFEQARQALLRGSVGSPAEAIQCYRDAIQALGPHTEAEQEIFDRRYKLACDLAVLSSGREWLARLVREPPSARDRVLAFRALAAQGSEGDEFLSIALDALVHTETSAYAWELFFDFEGQPTKFLKQVQERSGIENLVDKLFEAYLRGEPELVEDCPIGLVGRLEEIRRFFREELPPESIDRQVRRLAIENPPNPVLFHFVGSLDRDDARQIVAQTTERARGEVTLTSCPYLAKNPWLISTAARMLSQDQDLSPDARRQLVGVLLATRYSTHHELLCRILEEGREGAPTYRALEDHFRTNIDERAVKAASAVFIESSWRERLRRALGRSKELSPTDSARAKLALSILELSDVRQREIGLRGALRLYDREIAPQAALILGANDQEAMRFFERRVTPGRMVELAKMWPEEFSAVFLKLRPGSMLKVVARVLEYESDDETLKMFGEMITLRLDRVESVPKPAVRPEVTILANALQGETRATIKQHFALPAVARAMSLTSAERAVLRTAVAEYQERLPRPQDRAAVGDVLTMLSSLDASRHPG